MRRHATTQRSKRPGLDRWQYAKDIEPFVNLSKADQTALAKKAKAGDTEARDRLVCSCLRLVVAMAKRFAKTGIPLEDLVQAGNLGLFVAVDRFDPSRGAFSTIASWYAFNAMQEELRQSRSTIQLGKGILDYERPWFAAQSRLLGELGRSPTPDEMATALGISVERARRFGTYFDIRNPIPLPDVEGGEDFLATLSAEDPDPTEEAELREDLGHDLEELLRRVPSRARKVLRMRYGLDGGEPRTLEQVGAEVGVSKERVRQIQLKAIQRIRASERERKLA